MVVIDFERDTEYGVFRDAITLPDDHTLSQDEIDSLMQQRVDAWVDHVKNPPVAAPVPEYLEVDGTKYVSIQPQPDYIEVEGVKYVKAE